MTSSERWRSMMRAWPRSTVLLDVDKSCFSVANVARGSDLIGGDSAMVSIVVLGNVLTFQLPSWLCLLTLLFVGLVVLLFMMILFLMMIVLLPLPVIKVSVRIFVRLLYTCSYPNFSYSYSLPYPLF